MTRLSRLLRGSDKGDETDFKDAAREAGISTADQKGGPPDNRAQDDAGKRPSDPFSDGFVDWYFASKHAHKEYIPD